LTISSSGIVEVIVTYLEEKAWQYPPFSNCICKKLHIILWTISKSQIVYVNVTHHSMSNIKVSNCLCECYPSFYMNNIKVSNCYCECYIYHSMNNIPFSNYLRKMLPIILWTISKSQIVYAHHYMNSIKVSNCLCKCCTSLYEQHQVLKLFM
jgi:hypothetical protein